MLLAVGLFAGSIGTAIGAAFLERVRPNLALWQMLGLASLTAPLGWILFQAGILPIVLQDPQARARFGSIWPSYVRDVVLEPALKLWLCGGICAAFLWLMRARSDGKFASNSILGYRGLRGLSLACAAAILLPIGMELWVDNGRIGWRGWLLLPFCGFLAGFLPVSSVGIGLFLLWGRRGLRWAETFAPIYALAVGVGASLWYGSRLGRPGAWSILMVASFAIIGIIGGWLRIQRALSAKGAPARSV